MTRDEVKAEIAKVFYKRYKQDFNEIDENAPLSVILEIDERIDSLEIIEFLFDIEDQFALKNVDMPDPREAKIGDIVDSVHAEVMKKNAE